VHKCNIIENLLVTVTTITKTATNNFTKIPTVHLGFQTENIPIGRYLCMGKW